MAMNEIGPQLEDVLYGDVCHIIDGARGRTDSDISEHRGVHDQLVCR